MHTGVVENFLINQKACSLNVIHCNDGANFPAAYSVFTANIMISYVPYTTLYLCPPLVL